MSVLAWIGVIVLVLWAVAWLAFKVVSGLVHLLLILGLVLLVWALFKRGAKAIRRGP